MEKIVSDLSFKCDELVNDLTRFICNINNIVEEIITSINDKNLILLNTKLHNLREMIKSKALNSIDMMMHTTNRWLEYAGSGY